MPRDVYRTLRSLQNKQSLTIIEDEIDAESITEDNQHMSVCLRHSREWINAGSMVLANGFEPSLPGGDWLQSLIRQENLLCADCGYPIVSKTLEWCSHLFVSGALAELEVGPAARNVSGARMAAERIVTSVQ
jgi:hypothetical protein